MKNFNGIIKNKITKSLIFFGIFCAIFFIFSASSAQAATRTISDAGGNFNSTSTWVEGVVPTASDDVVATATSGPLTVNVASVAKTINFTNYTNTLTMNNTLTVSGNVTLVSAMTISGTSGLIINAASTITSNTKVWPNDLTLSTGITYGVTYTLADNLTASGNVNFAYTSDHSPTINGSTINVGGNLTISSASGFVTGTTNIVMNGTGTWSSSGGQLRNNLTFNTAGTITISGNVYYNTGTIAWVSGTAAGTGTLVSSVATTFNTSTFAWPNVTLNGSNNGANNTFTLNSDLTVTGNLTLGNGNQSTIVNGNNIYVGGNLAVSSTYNGNGSVYGTTNIILNGTGTWSVPGAMGILTNNLTINTAGTITVSGTVGYGAGTFTHTSGTILGTNTPSLSSGTATPGGQAALLTDIPWVNVSLWNSSGAWTIPAGVHWTNLTFSAYSGTYFTTTLAGDIYVTNLIKSNANGSDVVINSYTIYVSGNLTTGNNGAYLAGTANVVLNGTGTWSSSGLSGIKNNLTIDTTGTITISGTVYYSVGILTYTAGTVITTGSTLASYSGTFNTSNMTWNNVTFTGTNTTVTYTLNSNLNVSGNFNVGNSSYTQIINGYTINVNGNLTMNNINSAVNGTTTIVLKGTGTWSQPSWTTGYIANSLTINTAGTITISGNVGYRTRTLTYTAGTVTTTSSTLNIGADTTLNTSGISWNNIAVSAGTLTNNSVTGNGLVLTGDLTGAGGLTQGTNAILILGGASTITTLTASATGNLVKYTSTSGAQTVKSATYNNLTIDKTAQTATLGGAVTVNGNLAITSGTLDASASNYALGIKGNYTNSGIFTARSGTVTLSGTATQTIGGTLTGTSAFYDLTITNASGVSPTDCGLTTLTPSVIFSGDATATHNYVAITANTRVEYNSGSTYTFANINWNGQAAGTKIYFRNSTNNGTWYLNVSGTQTAVSNVDVSRSDALGGNQIVASNSTDHDCGYNLNWLFATGGGNPGDAGVGDKLKEAGTVHWTSPNTGATNSSLFTALPGGYSLPSLFGAPGPYGLFWSSTLYPLNLQGAWNRILSYFDNSVGRNSYSRGYGLSVRCVKDTYTPLSYTLTYTAGANGTLTGTEPQTVYQNGSGSAVTAVGNSGYSFVNWSDASTANPRTDTGVVANVSVTANFGIIDDLGGTITYVDSNGLNPRSSPKYTGGYTVHTFTDTGTSTYTATTSHNVSVLVVAGGGGTSGTTNSGGGGAGGLVYNSSLAVTIQSYSVVVGNGGVGSGKNGVNSTFSTITAYGGGYGGSGNQAGGNGGCGGGAGSTGGTYSGGTASQGFIGGSGWNYWAGAGGGMGGAGQDHPTTGVYGPGVSNSISGNSTTYSSGGYSSSPGLSGTNGSPNTGNGAGAAQGAAKTGGSGIVIIKYLSH